jgi:hypothetical protein
MEGSLARCERDVEAARARLAGNLQILRQPETVSSFTRAIKLEVSSAKDAAVESVKASASDAITGAIDTLKSKAAANPAALLAIGAGLAWHFIRNPPPIVSALVGAGLISLLKTPGPAHAPGADLVAQGRERLKEQAADFVNVAKDAAATATAAVSGTISELSKSGANAATELAHATGKQVGEAMSRGSDVIARMQHDVRDTVGEAASVVQGSLQNAVHASQRAFADASSINGRMMPVTPSQQDTILLGIAGVAVAAALGLAAQRIAKE